jgi:hypothetical protein
MSCVCSAYWLKSRSSGYSRRKTYATSTSKCDWLPHLLSLSLLSMTLLLSFLLSLSPSIYLSLSLSLSLYLSFRKCIFVFEYLSPPPLMIDARVAVCRRRRSGHRPRDRAAVSGAHAGHAQGLTHRAAHQGTRLSSFWRYPCSLLILFVHANPPPHPPHLPSPPRCYVYRCFQRAKV